MINDSLLASLPISAIINHLWQTTAVVGIVWILTSLLRRNRARLRLQLWLLASIKFLLPFSLLIAAGQHFRPATKNLAPAPNLAYLLTNAVQPYPGPTFAAGYVTDTRHEASPMKVELTDACLAFWFLGFIAVLAPWIQTWITLRRATRLAVPWATLSSVPIMRTKGLLEPGIFGIFHPVLLLPEDLLTRLPSQELDAIFAHELCHVRHRDNLTAALHTLVSALFWFHPVLWLIKTRMLDEREQACDENVVISGKDAQLYAQSILNVCKFYVEAPTAAMASVTGGNLKQRIVRIMSATSAMRLSGQRRMLLAVLALAVISLPLVVGVLNERQLHGQTTSPAKTFEVVSIHPEPNVTGMSVSVSPTSWDTQGSSLKLLIQDAFSLKNFQILNAPGWASERYTIHAKLPEGVSKLPDEEMEKEFGLMLQSMLVERCHLRYHWTTKILPVYFLVTMKGGAKIPSALPDDKYKLMIGANEYDAHAISIAEFAQNLGANLDRIVQDKTGLNGKYTFKLTYPPSPDAGATGVSPSSQVESEARLFSALQDQLGLKLVTEKQPVQMLVIDDIQRPTAN